MAGCRIYFIFCVLLFGTQVFCDDAVSEPANRTDYRFIGPFPSEYSISDHYSESEWEELISNNVNLSDFESVRNNIKTRLEECGFHLAGDFYETEIETSTGRYRRIWLGSLNGIMHGVLTMYTLGHPLHSRSLFYPSFNKDTRDAIEKRLAFSNYNYSYEYALMNRAFLEYSVNTALTLYRGVNAEFTVNVDDKFRFNQFTSTSRGFSVASYFLQPGGTMFIIDDARAMSMGVYSQYPTEEEYLISPFQRFKVTEITEQTSLSLGRITYIKLRRY